MPRESSLSGLKVLDDERGAPGVGHEFPALEIRVGLGVGEGGGFSPDVFRAVVGQRLDRGGGVLQPLLNRGILNGEEAAETAALAPVELLQLGGGTQPTTTINRP
jgi:hypothetical protein